MEIVASLIIIYNIQIVISPFLLVGNLLMSAENETGFIQKLGINPLYLRRGRF